MKKHLSNLPWALLLLPVFLFFSCKKEPVGPLPEPEPDPGIYRIPVVVHIIHYGESIGEGPNLSKARIEGQIRTLNEDFRRKAGSRGFNTHPDGGDAGMKFVLARFTPEGMPTEGIVRINAKETANPVAAWGFDPLAYYSYWPPEHYLNIWVAPLPEATADIVLGEANGPETDLPGSELFNAGEPYQAEGVIVNWMHFGESDHSSKYNLGRTLTHEIGHYFGLLHPWGARDCAANDYCEDTPAVDVQVFGCSPFQTCSGQQVMIANYMNWSDDKCMNLFTKDQIERMHYVLENSPRRKSLLRSPGLGDL